MIRKHRMPASFRHLVPPAFVIGLVGSLALAPLVPIAWRLALLTGPCLYGLILCGVGLRVSRRVGWRVGCLFPVAAATMHLAYGLGFMWGGLNGARASGVEKASTKDVVKDAQSR